MKKEKLRATLADTSAIERTWTMPFGEVPGVVGCGFATLEVFQHGLFFFSSRRRHTSLQGDWSSDVCSSDLDRQLVRIYDVAVEGDVHGVGPLEQCLRIGSDPVDGDELLLRRVEVAGAPEHDVARANRAAVEQHPQRHPPVVAGGRRLGRVEIAVRVEPEDADVAVPRGEAFDGADMRAAAAAEHDRVGGQVGGDGKRLHRERLLLDDGDLRIVESKRSRLDHRRAAVAPGARHPYEPGGEGATARVALVAVVDSHGRERPAGRAAGAQQTHRSAFPQTTSSWSTRMPTLS